MRERWIRSIGSVLVLAAALLLPTASTAQAPAADDGFTDSFRLQDCQFRTEGANPYFILRPGRRVVLEGEDDGSKVRLIVTVLHQTRRITLEVAGRPRTVVTRVVEERESKGGKLVEVSRNFFAICAQTNDVYYFGETVDIYDDRGRIVSHDGTWLAGRRGARPGLIMPGTFLLGSRYYQEVAPGVALDRAEHVRMGFSLETPRGVLEDCVEVVETTPLEPGAESTKIYCAGVGLAADNDLLLVEVNAAHDD